MNTATLAELDLADAAFPGDFRPCFATKSEAGGTTGLWHVHESMPHFADGSWTSSGKIFEVGVDDSDNQEPYRLLDPSQSLWLIV